MTTVKRNGIEAHLEGWQKTQRDSAQRWAAKQREQGRPSRKAKPRKKQELDWSQEVRDLAALRSGGLCELCVSRPADHLHHRKPRRHRDHRIENALHVCWHCHDVAIHGQDRKRADRCGWIVHSNANPAEATVILLGRRLLPTADGQWKEAA